MESRARSWDIHGASLNPSLNRQLTPQAGSPGPRRRTRRESQPEFAYSAPSSLEWRRIFGISELVFDTFIEVFEIIAEVGVSQWRVVRNAKTGLQRRRSEELRQVRALRPPLPCIETPPDPGGFSEHTIPGPPGLDLWLGRPASPHSGGGEHLHCPPEHPGRFRQSLQALLGNQGRKEAERAALLDIPCQSSIRWSRRSR
jgi:hypothetical protein